MRVSVLFNEPKLLKFEPIGTRRRDRCGFSALQRAEIAEIVNTQFSRFRREFCFSALQRAEIAEIVPVSIDELAEQRFQCSSTSRNC